MGMTYRIISPKPPVRAKDFRAWLEADQRDEWDDDGDSEWERAISDSDELVDDMVFDRESLAKWLGTKREDWLGGGLAFTISPEQVARAESVLTGLLETVRSLPYDKVKKGEARPRVESSYDYKTGKVNYAYFGSPKNVEILKVVNEVMNRDYHFTYPWDEDKNYNRVEEMISALKGVRKFMEENPDREVIGLYY